MAITFLDEPPAKRPGITFLDDEPEPREGPQIDEETRAFVDNLKAGAAKLDWDEMSQEELLASVATVAGLDPELGESLMPQARARAKRILKERGALLFEPGGDRVRKQIEEPITFTEMGNLPTRIGTRQRTVTVADPDGLNRSVANFLGFAGGTGAGALTDFQGWVGKHISGRRNQRAFEDQWNRINALSKENRAMYRFAYGETSEVFEGMGTLLGWVGGANALFRGSVGKSVFQQGADGKLVQAPWYKFVKEPVTAPWKLNPISRKGLAAGAGFDAAAGVVLGPEYVPSWLSELTGLEQSRLASGVESAALGAGIMTAQRKLTQKMVLGQLRQHPDFKDFKGSDRQFEKHVRSRMEQWQMDQMRRAEPPEVVSPDRRITYLDPEAPAAPAAAVPEPVPPAAAAAVDPAPPSVQGRPAAAARFEARMAQADAEAAARAAPEPEPVPAPAPEVAPSPPPDLTVTPALRAAVDPPAGSTAELLVDTPVIQVPRAQIVARPELMQFKRTDEAQSGVNAQDKLEGAWDDRKAGVLLLWEPKDPEMYGLKEGQQYIVANGHHRYEFGLRNQRKGFNSQVIREIDGWSPEEARAYAAEINIADGKGNIYDQARFFRNTAAVRGADAALERARQTGARGRKAATIGLDASDPVYTSFINEQIDPERAAAIAVAGKGDAALQSALLREVLENGMSMQKIAAFAGAMKSTQGDRYVQGGLYGDEEMIDVNRLADRVVDFERALSDRLRSVSGAAKRPEVARQLGVDVNDEAALQERIAKIRVLREKFNLERWYLDDEAKAVIHGSDTPDEYIQRQLTGDPPPPEDPNQMGMFEPPAAYSDPVRLRATHARLRDLQQARARGNLSPEGHAELEQAERDLGQEFFDWLDTVKRQEAAIGSATDEALRKAELAAASAKRLQAPDYISQQELFGGSKDQLELFEEAGQYLRSRGIESTEEAVRSLYEAAVHANARHKGAAADNFRQLLLDFSGREQLGSGSGPARGSASWLRVKESIFRHELIREGVFQHIGAKIDGPEDLAIIARNTLRNPRFETFYIIPVKDGRALMPYAMTSRCPYAAVVFAKGEDIKTIKGWISRHNPDGYYLLHNHPSGKTLPSSADSKVTADLVSELPGNFYGHVIINHDKWALGRLQHETEPWMQTLDDLLHAGNPGKRLPGDIKWTQHDIPDSGQDPLRDQASPIMGWSVSAPDDFRKYGQRLNDPRGLVTVFFKGRQGDINAVGTFSEADVMRPDFSAVLRTEALRHGAEAPALYIPSLVDKDQLFNMLRSRMLRGELFEVVTDTESFTEMGFGPREKGYMGQPIVGERVMEEAARYGKQPLLFVDDAGKTHAGPDLGLMDKVRVIDLPEIVQLARELLGELPKLKNLPLSNGLFKSGGKGAIVLNRSIFADPRQAAHTLAHEIGHLVDYLPDYTLKRGNLLGRLATLDNFLTTTLPRLESQSLDSIISVKDRRNLRRQAEREVGPRPPKDEEADLIAWRAEVSRVYRERILELIEDRNLIKLETVRQELLSLSADWRGDWSDAAASYRKYRESGKELYADALSVLINDPAYLKARAPEFWDLFFEYLGRKPEVEQALHELYDFLARGELAVLRERQAKLRGGFERGEEVLLGKARERKLQRETARGMIDRLLQDYHDAAWPMIRRANEVDPDGTKLPWHEDPRNLWSAHPLHENRIYRFLDRMHARVVEPLHAAGIGMEDLGEFLFYNRVLNETFVDGHGRGQIANPFGIQPPQARKGLLLLRLQHKSDGMELIERAATAVQDMFFDLAREMSEVGLISRRNFRETVEPNRYNYAPFAAVDHLAVSPHIPAGLRRQAGMLKETANPFTAMVVKSITALRAIEHQRMKLNTRGFLGEWFPGDIEPARVTIGEGGRRTVHEPPTGSDKQLVTFFNDGKIDGFYADPLIARMFEMTDPDEMGAILKVLNFTFREGMYKLWVQYSPSFLFWTNPLRDFKRTWQNLPIPLGRAPAGVEGFVKKNLGRIPTARLLGAYIRSWADARARISGDMTPIVREMMDNHAFGTPFDLWVRNADTGRREDYYLELMRRYHLAPEAEQEATLMGSLLKPVMSFLNYMNVKGQTIESVSRISAYRILRDDLGWHPDQAAKHVREHIGTPPFWRKGKKTIQANAALPFFNVAEKGYATDLKLMTQPKTRAGYWWRWARGDGKWAVLKAAATLGLLGEGLQRLFEAMSPFDVTNSNVIPLGEIEEGEFGRKTAYIRVPPDETSRLMSGVLYTTLVTLGRNLMDDQAGAQASFRDVFSYAAGQLPGIHPLIGLASTWSQYMAGLNPRDTFRGAPLLTNDQWLAGGTAGLRPLLAYTLSETGVTNFIRWDPEANTSLEWSVNMTPILNRAVRFSDAGLRARQLDVERAGDRVGAQLRLAMDPDVGKLLEEHGRLRALREENRSSAQQERYEQLRTWHSKVYWPIYTRMREQVLEGYTGDLPYDLEDLRLESEPWRD
jgi:hypothetical protein